MKRLVLAGALVLGLASVTGVSADFGDWSSGGLGDSGGFADNVVVLEVADAVVVNPTFEQIASGDYIWGGASCNCWIPRVPEIIYWE